MAELYYQWGDEALQDSPAPPKDTTVVLWVGPYVVWQGHTLEALRTWGRWCALQSAHLWDCPDVAHDYLRTGDPTLRVEALAAIRSTASSAKGAIWQAARGASASAVIDPATDRGWADDLAWTAPRDAFVDSTWALARQIVARNPTAEMEAAKVEARNTHAGQLRTLLLRGALPEDRWPLVDGFEGVLCDALLEEATC